MTFAPDTIANEIYTAFLPLVEQYGDEGGMLYDYIFGLSTMLQPIDDLSSDGANNEPGWSQVLDLNRAKDEWLPWMGQWVGYFVTARRPIEDPVVWSDRERARMITRSSHRRGTIEIIKEIAKENLVGAKEVYIRERDGDPYVITVVTFSGQTPDPIALEEAVRYQKAAGLIMNFSNNAGQDYGLLLDPPTLPIQTYAQTLARYTNYEAARRDVP